MSRTSGKPVLDGGTVGARVPTAFLGKAMPVPAFPLGLLSSSTTTAASPAAADASGSVSLPSGGSSSVARSASRAAPSDPATGGDRPDSVVVFGVSSSNGPMATSVSIRRQQAAPVPVPLFDTALLTSVSDQARSSAAEDEEAPHGVDDSPPPPQQQQHQPDEDVDTNGDSVHSAAAALRQASNLIGPLRISDDVVLFVCLFAAPYYQVRLVTASVVAGKHLVDLAEMAADEDDGGVVTHDPVVRLSSRDDSRREDNDANGAEAEDDQASRRRTRRAKCGVLLSPFQGCADLARLEARLCGELRHGTLRDVAAGFIAPNVLWLHGGVASTADGDDNGNGGGDTSMISGGPATHVYSSGLLRADLTSGRVSRVANRISLDAPAPRPFVSGHALLALTPSASSPGQLSVVLIGGRSVDDPIQLDPGAAYELASASMMRSPTPSRQSPAANNNMTTTGSSSSAAAGGGPSPFVPVSEDDIQVEPADEVFALAQGSWRTVRMQGHPPSEMHTRALARSLVSCGAWAVAFEPGQSWIAALHPQRHVWVRIKSPSMNDAVLSAHRDAGRAACFAKRKVLTLIDKFGSVASLNVDALQRALDSAASADAIFASPSVAPSKAFNVTTPSHMEESQRELALETTNEERLVARLHFLDRKMRARKQDAVQRREDIECSSHPRKRESSSTPGPAATSPANDASVPKIVERLFDKKRGEKRERWRDEKLTRSMGLRQFPPRVTTYAFAARFYDIAKDREEARKLKVTRQLDAKYHAMEEFSRTKTQTKREGLWEQLYGDEAHVVRLSKLSEKHEQRVRDQQRAPKRGSRHPDPKEVVSRLSPAPKHHDDDDDGKRRPTTGPARA